MASINDSNKTGRSYLFPVSPVCKIYSNKLERIQRNAICHIAGLWCAEPVR